MDHLPAPIVVRPDPAPPPALPHASTVDIVAAFLSGRNPRTLRAYSRDLEDFARFLGQPTAGVAVELLLSGSQGQANLAVHAYKGHLAARGLASATVARRLAALRSMVKLARQVGKVEWLLEAESPRVETLRDTAGPGAVGYRAMRGVIADDASPKAVRDRAVVRMLHDLALRRGELCGLDLVDVDRDSSRVAVLGKGRTGKEWLTLPGPTLASLEAWLAVRGGDPGPLFHRLDRATAADKGRLTGEAVRQIVRDLGRKAGLGRDVRPHGLRHLAITTALDRTNGDVRTVQRFSRHKKLDVLMVYDDRRKDAGGSVARLVADD
jgi:integrase/recombinase XerC